MPANRDAALFVDAGTPGEATTDRLPVAMTGDIALGAPRRGDRAKGWADRCLNRPHNVT
jgi:hypothetical protein